MAVEHYTKVCVKCSQELPISCFTKNNRRSDGHTNVCKPCRYAQDRKRFEQLPQEVAEKKKADARARAKLWAKENPERVKANADRWKAENEERYKATKKKWSVVNREHKAALDRAWKEANKDRHREVKRAWNERNAEKLKQQCRAWRRAHSDRVNFQSRNWYANNRSRAREIKKTWRDANPAKNREYATVRRERVVQPAWASKEKIAEIYRKASELKRETGVEYAVDHIVPIKSDLVCGLHCEANLQILTKSDNSKKGNRWWPDMPE